MNNQSIFSWTPCAAVLVVLTNCAVAQYQLEDVAVVADDAAAGDWFGADVAVRDGFMIVGARRSDSATLVDAGSAYVFRRTANGWVQDAELTASPGSNSDIFGATVEIGGNYAFVGAWGAGPFSQGAVYVYQLNGKNWAPSGILASSMLATADGFGFDIDLSQTGTDVIIGAPWGDGVMTSTGIATIYSQYNGAYLETGNLFANDGEHVEAFGAAVAIDGDTALVGAYKELDGTGQFGAIYFFERVSGDWIQTQKLRASDATNGDSFGQSLDLAGDRAIVGAPMRDGEEGGAYTFVRTPTGWVEEEIIDGWAVTQDEQFGYTVALSWPYAVVGSNETAYFLERLPTGWEIRDALVATDYQPGTAYGRIVAADNGTAIVAAPGSMQAGVDSGASYIFSMSPQVANYCIALPNSSGLPAAMAAAGSASLSANNLSLIAGPIDSGQPGLFFFGQAEILVPFGNGNRCIGGSLHLVHPIAHASTDGYLTVAFDNTQGALISAGETWKFQAWFRDPNGGGVGFDLSDGMSVFFGP